MADVGKSTAEHSALHGEDVPPWVIAALDNWGAWQAAIDLPLLAIPASPMFREYVAGYRETPASRAYEAEPAEFTDAEIARMSRQAIDCFVVRFVLQKSSREAARSLSMAGYKTREGSGITHSTYRRWLDQALMIASALMDERCAPSTSKK